MKTHRVGIIGLGTVGARFVEQFNLHERFELTACWDASSEAKDRFRSTENVVETPGDVIANCDVVYIAVPPAAHATYVEQAVAAKCAIFCEKPLGVDIVESEHILQLVESSGLPSAINYVFGSAPSAVELGRRVSAGELGDIVSVEFMMHLTEWPRAWQAAATWLAEAAEGGWIREVGSHYVFLAQRLFGEVALEHCLVRRPETHLAENLVTARLNSGQAPFTMHCESGSAGIDSLTFTVRGSQQSMRIVDWYNVEATNSEGVWTPVEIDASPSAPWAAYRSQLDGLAAMLDGDTHHLPTFAEALGVQRVVEGVLAN
ncbi:MAG: Gfo/Idh/MocA family oxidoreductase [Ilumatobacteraceae bacterium]|nr:Gfo/Idh/MocA family oxidoreductase [Ilumatobacteraceae bacterium]